ncbi:MAG: DUF4433 domain-containing protein [Pseudomonadales bacterium]
MPRYQNLNAERALIWRIVHRQNVPWILENGLHCSNSDVRDPEFIQIGNEEIIEKRTGRDVPIHPGGSLSDYVPFYFTPFSPMMFNIHTGHGVHRRDNREICILVSSLHKVQEAGVEFVFTDRHAYQPLAEYYSEIEDLVNVDWASLRERDFRRDPENPLKFEKYQAEALVYRHLPVECLIGIVCYDANSKEQLTDSANERGIDLDIEHRPGWYF